MEDGEAEEIMKIIRQMQIKIRDHERRLRSIEATTGLRDEDDFS